MGQGSSNIGQKIREGFDWLGKKMNEGWESTKAWGKKAWDTIKNVPVIGKVASFIEQSPIGTGFKQIGNAIDTGVGATSKLFQGDVKGAVGRVTEGGRQAFRNIAEDKTFKTITDIPVLGEAIKNAPVLGGFSYNNIAQIGNSALNAVDAIKEGDVKGALTNSLEIGKGLASKGLGGSNLQKAVNIGSKIQTGVDVAQKVMGK
jgi:hypothetical protein